MTQKNLYLMENKKPVELVQELKSEIPTYEEFLKTYKRDDKVNASYESEINAYGDLGVEKGYGPMPKYWCINCVGERQHAYVGCHGACNNNCNHRCESCGLETLANISEPSLGDNTTQVIKQGVAQAQRKAQRDGLTGEVRVKMIRGNASRSDYHYEVLVYNTYTKEYRIDL